MQGNNFKTMWWCNSTILIIQIKVLNQSQGFIPITWILNIFSGQIKKEQRTEFNREVSLPVITAPAILGVRIYDQQSNGNDAYHSRPATTPTTRQGHIPELHIRQPGPLMALFTAILEIDETQPRVDHEYLLTFVDNNRLHASRTSRSPSVVLETVPVAEYQKWPFKASLNAPGSVMIWRIILGLNYHQSRNTFTY